MQFVTRFLPLYLLAFSAAASNGQKGGLPVGMIFLAMAAFCVAYAVRKWQLFAASFNSGNAHGASFLGCIKWSVIAAILGLIGVAMGGLKDLG
jgi:hypothetical protein